MRTAQKIGTAARSGHGCQMAGNPIPKERRDSYSEHLDDETTETAASAVRLKVKNRNELNEREE
jgi:hypothetical protein